MKRTKNINHDRFRKSWPNHRLAPVALAITAVLMLSGCEEKRDQTVTLFQNAEECTQANPSMAEQCNTSYQQALQEAQRTAPKFSSYEDCVAEFGDSQCVETPSNNTSSSSGLHLSHTTYSTTQSFSDPNSVTQATGESAAHPANSASSSSSHSIWMPVMAGYMYGRMLNSSYTNTPLFTSKSAQSPLSGRFVDATGRSFGSATTGRSIQVDKNVLAPKPATTNTITRGGFGETVAKQSLATQQSERSHASAGGGAGGKNSANKSNSYKSSSYKSSSSRSSGFRSGG